MGFYYLSVNTKMRIVKPRELKYSCLQLLNHFGTDMTKLGNTMYEDFPRFVELKQYAEYLIQTKSLSHRYNFEGLIHAKYLSRTISKNVSLCIIN